MADGDGPGFERKRQQGMAKWILGSQEDVDVDVGMANKLARDSFPAPGVMETCGRDETDLGGFFFQTRF